MPDEHGRIRGISVGRVPWHSATADATLDTSQPLEPDEVVVNVDPLQEVAAVLTGRNVMRVYRIDDAAVIETSDSRVVITPRDPSGTWAAPATDFTVEELPS